MQFLPRASSFRNYTRSFRAAVDYIDPHVLYRDARREIFNLLNSFISLRIRIIICAVVFFTKWDDREGEIVQQFYFCSSAERILSHFQILGAVDRCFAHILRSIECFIHNGSGWVIRRISFLDINIGNYRARRGGCKKHVILPKRLKNKKAILNIKCSDNRCFLHCIAAAVYPVKSNACRALKYKNKLQNFNTRKLTFPVPISQIKYFEKANRLHINVYGYDTKLREIYPYYFSEQYSPAKEIDLLLFKRHYFLIKKFNALMNNHNNEHYFCKKCLSGFTKREGLERHKTLCISHKPQKLSIPENKLVKFTDLSKCLFHQYVIYADFEALTKKIDTALPDPSTAYSTPLEMHEAVSYTILVIGPSDDIVYHEYFVGPGAVGQFLDALKMLADKLLRKMHLNRSPADGHIYDLETCHICGRRFKKGEIKCVDHCHSSGLIRGLAHQACNLNYRSRFFIPVIIHNAKNYDTHFILKNMPRHFAEDMKIIPCNTEKFLMFTLDSLKFLDSYQFLNASLEELVHNLQNSGHEFKIFNRFFSNGKSRLLLKRKGIFPYSFLDNLEKLKTPHLPSIESFFNVLTNTPLNPEEYEYAKSVYKAFDCHNLGEYLELYQNLDVVLLAEVFTSFRRMSMENFQLDPVHFITSAQLTWNAGLKFAKIQLELLHNIDDYLWLERQIRGGICLLGTRHVTVNNPLLPQFYNEEKSNNYILPLDVVNLYGFTMCEYLPEGNFTWLEESAIENFNVYDYGTESNVGFFIECDLVYPKHMHNFTNDLPPAPDHLIIKYEMLSDYSKKLCDKFNLKHTLPSKKLTPNFYPKKNYVLHYRNLQYYLKLGMKLKKIHRILSFNQSPWLRSYIEFLHEKRKNASDEFTKSFYKRMINSFFGRLMLNVRKKKRVLAALNEKTCQKHLASPLLDYFEPVNENLTLFKMHIPQLVLDKPIFAGFCILELSKLRMYELYYTYFKQTYADRCELLYIDTDSLYIHITTSDIFLDLKTNFENILDTSNFHPSHVLYNVANKNKLGVLKFESVDPVIEFVGLKAKQYALSYEGNRCKKTAKGVKKSIVETYNFETYKSTLLNEVRLKNKQCFINSKHHHLYTFILNKSALCAYYDKKKLGDDGITSFCYGHYSTL